MTKSFFPIPILALSLIGRLLDALITSIAKSFFTIALLTFLLIGRPFLYAAAIGGVPSVLHAIGILKAEIDRDMALLGVNRLSELTPDFLLRGPQQAKPHHAA